MRSQVTAERAVGRLCENAPDRIQAEQRRFNCASAGVTGGLQQRIHAFVVVLVQLSPDYVRQHRSDGEQQLQTTSRNEGLAR